jgi:hypothetical protein
MRAMITVDAAQLADLAGRVRRLSPSHRDPERFHFDKDAIEKDLRRMSRLIDKIDYRR